MLKEIYQYIDKFRQFDDDFDGEYIYKKEVDPVTSLISRLVKKTTVKKDRRQKAFGRIKGNIFYYITFPMIIILLLVAWAAVVSFETLLPYFETNVFLNGLIISFMLYGILKTFYNSFLLYKTAYFFRLLESITRQDNIPITDIYKLRRSLEKDGHLVNTIAMAETIDNMEKFGHPNFNDHRARLIKSKMGFRVSKNKANVSYISGILVMLGLLGTFLGLLATIDSVGEALGGMANIGSGGQVGVDDMNKFISSLAKPLEGMGLAFSSSLFGLSGSLLIGFFLYLSGTPQNYFMENISRWIDDRIPVHKPQHLKDVVEGEKKEGEKKEGADQEAAKEDKVDEQKEREIKLNPPVKDQDLKDWLSGHVYMSVRLNKQIENLCAEISSSTNEIQQVTQDNQVIRQTQSRLVEIMNSGNMLLQNIANNNQNVAQEISRIASNGEQLNDRVVGINNQVVGIGNNVAGMKAVQDSSKAILSSIGSQVGAIAASLDINKEVVQQLHNNTVAISKLVEQNDQQFAQMIQQNDSQFSQLMQQSENQFGVSSDFDNKTLGLLNLIKDIAQDANEIRLKSENTSQSNTDNTLKALDTIQTSLSNIIEQFGSINKEMTSDKITPHIRSIEEFIVRIDASQQELIKSSKALQKEIADSAFGSKNKTLVQKIEDKISRLEEDLTKLFKK